MIFLRGFDKKLIEYRNLPEIKPLIAPSEGRYIVDSLEKKYADQTAPISLTVVGTGRVAEDVVTTLRNSSISAVKNAEITILSTDEELLNKFLKKHDLKNGLLHAGTKPLTPAQIITDIIVVARSGDGTALITDASLTAGKPYALYDVAQNNGISVTTSNTVSLTNLDNIQTALADYPEVHEMTLKFDEVHEVTSQFIAAQKQADAALSQKKPRDLRKAFATAYEATDNELLCRYPRDVKRMTIMLERETHQFTSYQTKVDRSLEQGVEPTPAEREELAHRANMVTKREKQIADHCESNPIAQRIIDEINNQKNAALKR